MKTLKGVVFDLDGVIRQFERGRAHAIAEAHGTTLDVLAAAAFSKEMHRLLVTGRISRAEWVERVAVASGYPEAVRAWLDTIGELDPDTVQVIRELRAAGTPVGLLTNGTDTIRAELTTLGIIDLFDGVVSTWDVGIAKPDAGAFEAAAASLQMPPGELLFIDDRADNVAGAEAVGMTGHQFVGVPSLRGALESHGFLPSR